MSRFYRICRPVVAILGAGVVFQFTLCQPTAPMTTNDQALATMLLSNLLAFAQDFARQALAAFLF